MMNKFLSVLTAATFLAQSVYAQSGAADSSKQLKAGDTIELTGGVTVKITKADKSPFKGVSVKGEPYVVVFDLDSGKKRARLGYQLSTDPRWSDVYMTSGEQTFAPRAVIEDFPSRGSDNDKEIEVLDPKDKAVGVSLQFQGKGSVSLLFDVPPDKAKTPKKLSINLQTVEPAHEQRSFTVTL
jgi:hypothetical protein